MVATEIPVFRLRFPLESIGVHWSPLASIGVEELTCMLEESIGVGDLVELVELVEFVPKKDLH